LNTTNCNILKTVYKLDIQIYRLKRLLLDLEWMYLIKNGTSVYAEFEDWVNKSLSRTSIRIFCESSSGYKELVIPQHYWAGHSSFEILEQFIPWADYDMDIEAYEEYMQEIYEDECYAGYDKEDDMVYYTESFDDWYKPPQGIVPIGENGEVATYRVILKLNDLGLSFITVSEYLYDDSLFEHHSFSLEEIV